MKMAQSNNWCGFKRQEGDKEVEIISEGKSDRNMLSIKVDVDVSEALTGLKAVQREAKEAAKVLRELESAVLHKGEVILPKNQVVRNTNWTVVQASKKEGASVDELDTFYFPLNESVDGTLNELRHKGYRIFYLYKSIGIIDDFIQK
jgi:hypothetical protein